MKAILEFDAPKSCIECKLSVVACDFLDSPACVALFDKEGNGKISKPDYFKPNGNRPPFCPLRIVEDGE